MECCNYDPRRYFLFGMRVFFGTWLLYVGLVKWVVFGAGGFVAMITSQFDVTWSPHILNVALGWLIVCAEPLAGLWILSGKKHRMAWSATAILMFLLTFGQTMLMKQDVADNWQYVLMALVCAALSEPEVSSSNCQK